MPITYSFGWHPSLPDIRDLQYQFVPRRDILMALPSSVDNSSPDLGDPWDPTWNQENIGSCGPHSSLADVVSALIRVQGIQQPPMPSRLYTYYNSRAEMGAQYIDQDSGVDNRSMMKALNKWGWCDESRWPYDTAKFKIKPPQACYEQGSTRRIVEYNNVPQDLMVMKACLAGGDCFIFGFTVFSSMQTPQVERTGIIPMPTMQDRVQGGHDILFVGYDDYRQMFKLRNSWSPEWGEDGYGWIPYSYATNPRLSSDFWTVKKSPWPTTPIPPGPTPAPGTTTFSFQSGIAVGEYKAVNNQNLYYPMTVSGGNVKPGTYSLAPLSAAPEETAPEEVAPEETTPEETV